METVADALEKANQRDDPLFAAPGRPTPMSTQEVVASARQMGNLFRHYGVRPGERVAIVSGPTDPGADDEPGHLGTSPVPILAVIGGLLAGGVVDLDPPRAVDAAVLVLPAAWLERYRTGPGTTAIAYGDDPGEPGVAHLEREAWSENRTRPPVDLDATTPALAADRVYAHADLVTAAHRLVTDRDLGAVDRLSLTASLTTAGALVAGVVTPLLTGATVVPGDGDASVVITSEENRDARRIDPASLFGEDT